MENFNSILEKAKAEIEAMTHKEKDCLCVGIDNRGIKCISERWYGPESMKDNSALSTLGDMAREINNLLMDFFEHHEPDEGVY